MSRGSREHTGQQKINVGSSQTQPIEPQSNGVSDGEAHVDITIQNTGAERVVIRSDSNQNDIGYNLFAQGDSLTFNDHTPLDGDIHVYFPASAGGEVNAIFSE